MNASVPKDGGALCQSIRSMTSLPWVASVNSMPKSRFTYQAM